MAKNSGKKKRGWIIAIVVVAVVVVGVLALQNFMQNSMESFNMGYEVHVVETGDMQIEVTGSGSVESLDTTTHYAKIAGQVDELPVENGDIVAKGDVIAILDSSNIDATIDGIKAQIDTTQQSIASLYSTTGSTSIKSPVAGVVKAIYVVDEQDVNIAMENYGSLMLLSVDGRMKLDVMDLDTDMYTPGDAVQFVIGEETVDGVVYSINDGMVTFTVMDDDYGMDTQVVVNDMDGNKIAEGNLEINMPFEIVDYEGVVSDIKVDVGDDVSKNKTLISRDGEIPSTQLADQTQQLQDLYDDLDEAYLDREALTIKADLDGIITDLTISLNANVMEGAPVYTIQTTEELMLNIQVDELDIAMIEVGQQAEITMDALYNQNFTGFIEKINPIGHSINNVTTYTVTLSVEGNEDVLIGMSATVDILTEDKEGIVLIPIEAIQNREGKQYVLMADELDLTTEATHEVEVGLSDGVNIEVLSGLESGDDIAIKSNDIENLGMFAGAGPGGDR